MLLTQACTLQCRAKMDPFFSVCGWNWATVCPTEFFLCLECHCLTPFKYGCIFSYLSRSPFGVKLSTGMANPLRWEPKSSIVLDLRVSRLDLFAAKTLLSGANLLGISITTHRSRIRKPRFRFSQSRDIYTGMLGKLSRVLAQVNV